MQKTLIAFVAIAFMLGGCFNQDREHSKQTVITNQNGTIVSEAHYADYSIRLVAEPLTESADVVQFQASLEYTGKSNSVSIYHSAPLLTPDRIICYTHKLKER